MPDAAWCSACQKYVWVSPEGRCQFGHGPEFLSGRYIDAAPDGLDEQATSMPDPPHPHASTPPAVPPVEPAPTMTAVILPPPPEPPAIPLTPELTHHMWLRFAAFAIDYVLAQLTALILTSVPFIFYFALVADQGTSAIGTTVASLLSIAVFLGYYVVTEALFSSTPGKLMFGMRVVNASSGARIGWRESVIRNTLLVVDLFFWGLVGLVQARGSDWRQRFGDSKAGTIVIRAGSRERFAPPSSFTVSAAPPAASPLFSRSGLTVIAIVVLLAIASFALLSWAVLGPGSTALEVPTSDLGGSGPTIAPQDSASADGESAVVPSASDVATMSEAEWDAFVAKQYPGYRVEERLVQPDQFNSGQTGVNYVLVNTRYPTFRLLVSLTQSERGDSLEGLPEAYLDVVDGIATTDGLFSTDAVKLTPYLQQRGQESIIKAYVAKAPAKRSLAYGGFGDEGEVYFNANVGEDQVALALRNYTTGQYGVTATIPHGPRNSKTEVDLVKW